jgi:hypothetical protein
LLFGVDRARQARMSPERILYPAYPMFLVFVATFARLAQLRFGAVSSGKMDPAYYRLFAGGEEPPEIRVVSRHFQNQFEVPPLFYTAVLIAYVTHSVNVWTVFLAWAYVALRIVHTVVHLGSNDVLTRFRLYGASNLVLTVLWTSVFAMIAFG